MKNTLKIFTLFLLVILSTLELTVYSQGRPYKNSMSPVFGKDIIIDDKPEQDQSSLAVCSAYNGWLYSIHSYFNYIHNSIAFTISKSIDNGITWSILIDQSWPDGNVNFNSLDIIVTGNTPTNLKIFLASSYDNGPSNIGSSVVYRYDESTGLYEDCILWVVQTYNVAFATDALNPSINSNPFSIGVLYSIWNVNSGNDSLIFLSSSNGGISFDSRKIVALTPNHFHKVALAYGKSPAWDGGNYFAAWEEQDDYGAIPGHIFTSHTSDGIDSPFTTPVQLDNIDPDATNQCSHPVIACQYNNANNDSLNITEIVMFEKYNSSNGNTSILGFYNPQGMSSNHFTKMNITDSIHNCLQPDINFNPYDSTFMLTYYDATSKKLPFLRNNFNLQQPNQWEVVSSGYNDSSNLSAPHPKVDINVGAQEGMNVWNAKSTGGNGIAMFDARYSVYTGIGNANNQNRTGFLRVYPNPCSTYVKCAFDLPKAQTVDITIYNLLGQSIKNIQHQHLSAGIHNEAIDISNLPEGTYFVLLKTANRNDVEKIQILRY